MKTIKLYDEMPYSTDFKATVVEVNKNEIILDQTLFFPEEGGQECDLGTINDIPVKDVQIKNDVIIHYVKKHHFNVGDTIEGHIDWKRRYSFMQNHTGEHLLSGIVHSMYGCDNVSFHLNSEEGQVEYDGDIKDIDLIEEKVNQAIYENKEIHCFYPDDLESISYRSKKEIDVSRIAACFGGGGHIRAAGFNAKGTVYEIVNRIGEMIEQQYAQE
ncbi:MAG: hypothetical protein EGQ25_00045 [Catenibacterium mitsuokai]|nr:hypothetical protein [Catenibacterium mitsuokai]